MARSEALGIKRLAAVHFYVNDLDRGFDFWVKRLDFAHIGGSSAAHEAATGQRSAVFRAGTATYLYTQPVAPTSTSARYLKRHPDGVAELIFEVESVEKTFAVLNERGAAILGDVVRVEQDGGVFASFSIVTAFGDARFTFVQRDGFAPLVPGMEVFAEPKGGANCFEFGEIDHVTSNFVTLQPLVLWCATAENHTGSGLRSVVLWDPHSGVKFANNEPMRPYFEKSQVYTFVEDNYGPGIQHTALTIRDIVGTVAAMRERGVPFMPTPASYYEMLPPRLAEDGIVIDEPLESLRSNEILVDGEGPGRYLLQIFAKDFAAIYGNANGGPFFLEIIQRKGDRGFGGGNFRALFESIEREQVATGRV